eukprot:CCRYP_006810-RA/>CCRYP_006810-RA protein AED:0.09 eAED:0.13 QI:0/0/0.33/1/0/0/3/4761/97
MGTSSYHCNKCHHLQEVHRHCYTAHDAGTTTAVPGIQQGILATEAALRAVLLRAFSNRNGCTVTQWTHQEENRYGMFRYKIQTITPALPRARISTKP